MDTTPATINYDDFAKLDLRIATVIECRPHENADKLLVLQILCCVTGVTILYLFLDRTLRQDETAQFRQHGMTVTEAVAKSCESPLVARDLKSQRGPPDRKRKRLPA